MFSGSSFLTRISLAVLLALPCPAAVNVTDSSSDRIDLGSPASLDDLSAYTILLWVKPSTLTQVTRLSTKEPGAGGNHVFRLGSGAANDELFFVRTRATTTTVYETDNSNLTTGKWWFIALVWDDAQTPEVRIYVGDLNTLATERTYTTSTDGSGALTTDAADPWQIGNRNGGSDALGGDYAFYAIFNTMLTTGQIHAQQFRPHKTASSLVLSLPGFDGTSTAVDLSGNGLNGTMSGVTNADHAPLPQPF